MRIMSGLTQEDLGGIIDRSQPYIARVESGRIDPPLSVTLDIIRALSIKQETCADVMTPNPDTIDTRSIISHAVTKMKEGNYSQLPVIRPGGKIHGIVTAMDIISNLDLDFESDQVGRIMRSAAVFDESTPVSVILPLFADNHAVLVENQKQGRLTGIIALSDLLRLEILSIGLS